MQKWKNKWKMSKSSVTSIAGICCFRLPWPSPILLSQSLPGHVVQVDLTAWSSLCHGYGNMTQACEGSPFSQAPGMGSQVSKWPRLSQAVSASTFLMEFKGRSSSSLRVGSRLHVNLEMLKTTFTRERWRLDYIISASPSLGLCVIWANSHFCLSQFKLESVACNRKVPD